MALETDPATLNPILFRGGTEYDLDWILFDSLVELGRTSARGRSSPRRGRSAPTA